MSVMTPKERVIAALEHRQPDKIPWGEHFIDSNVYEDVLGRKSLAHAKFEETKAYWEGRRDEVVSHYKRDIVDLTLALEMDLVTTYQVPPKGYSPKPMEKISDNTYRDEEENIHKVSEVTHDLMQVPINTAAFKYNITISELQQLIDEVDAMSPPVYDPNDSTYEVIQHVVDKLSNSHYIIAPINGIEWARFGVDEEESWVNLLLYPDICKKIAELQAKQSIRELHILSQIGVDGILSVGDLGFSTGLAASPQIYRDVIYPWQKKLTEVAQSLGLKMLRHCCGHVWPIVNELAELNDAYEGIQASAGMDIKNLKEKVGDKLCLWGGIWHENIHGGSVEQIREDAKYSFTHAAKNGGYIMGSSHSLAVGAKIENIMEMKRCRDEWNG